MNLISEFRNKIENYIKCNPGCSTRSIIHACHPHGKEIKSWNYLLCTINLRAAWLEGFLKNFGDTRCSAWYWQKSLDVDLVRNTASAMRNYPELFGKIIAID